MVTQVCGSGALALSLHQRLRRAPSSYPGMTARAVGWPTRPTNPSTQHTRTISTTYTIRHTTTHSTNHDTVSWHAAGCGEPEGIDSTTSLLCARDVSLPVTPRPPVDGSRTDQSTDQQRNQLVGHHPDQPTLEHAQVAGLPTNIPRLGGSPESLGDQPTDRQCTS